MPNITIECKKRLQSIPTGVWPQRMYVWRNGGDWRYRKSGGEWLWVPRIVNRSCDHWIDHVIAE